MHPYCNHWKCFLVVLITPILPQPQRTHSRQNYVGSMFIIETCISLWAQNTVFTANDVTVLLCPSIYLQLTALRINTIGAINISFDYSMKTLATSV